jgi:hypothetical protein
MSRIFIYRLSGLQVSPTANQKSVFTKNYHIHELREYAPIDDKKQRPALLLAGLTHFVKHK